MITLSDTLSFNRNTTATYWGSDGLLKMAAIGELRQEYDPATLDLRGILIEAISITNSLLNNRNLVGVNWSSTGTIASAKDEIGLEGNVNTAHTITDSDTGVASYIEQDIPIGNNGNLHSAYLYLKKTASQDPVNPAIQVSLTGGTAEVIESDDLSLFDGTLTENQTSGSVKFVEDYGDWWRIYFSPTNNSTGNTNLNFRIYPAGLTASDTNSIIYDYGQVVLDGDFNNQLPPCNPIETTNSAGVRGGDTLLLNRWKEYPNYTGTFIGIFNKRYSSSNNGRIFSGDNSDSVFDSNDGVIGTIGSGSRLSTTNAFDLGTDFNSGVTWDVSGRSICLDGGTVKTDSEDVTNTTFNPANDWVFGKRKSNDVYNSGPLYIKSLDHYPFRITDQQLQSILYKY